MKVKSDYCLYQLHHSIRGFKHNNDVVLLLTYTLLYINIPWEFYPDTAST